MIQYNFASLRLHKNSNYVSIPYIRTMSNSIFDSF